jgi:hypothetical protein
MRPDERTQHDGDVCEGPTTRAILKDDVDTLPAFVNFMLLPWIDQLREEREFNRTDD